MHEDLAGLTEYGLSTAVLNRLRFEFFFFSSRRRHTRYIGDWSSDVCSSDLFLGIDHVLEVRRFLDVGRLGVPIENFAGRHGHAFPIAVSVEGLSVFGLKHIAADRSEERRVGKECRWRWWPEH